MHVSRDFFKAVGRLFYMSVCLWFYSCPLSNILIDFTPFANTYPPEGDICSAYFLHTAKANSRGETDGKFSPQR